MSTSRIARAAEANRKLRSAALSRTASPSRRITASWTTAVGESVWSGRSRRISRAGHPAQLVVDPRDQLTPGPIVPVPGPSQDQRQFPLRLGIHRPPQKSGEGYYGHFPRDPSRGKYRRDSNQGNELSAPPRIT